MYNFVPREQIGDVLIHLRGLFRAAPLFSDEDVRAQERRELYMPALVASRCDPHGKAFFESLLARNKARLQALIAVARKLLHAIYGMFRSGLKYEGTKLFPRISLS